MKNKSAYFKINLAVIFIIALVFFALFCLRFFCVQTVLIDFAERRLLHRGLNHELWLSRFNYVSSFSFLIPVVFASLLMKAFSFFFANRVKDSFLNLLRCVACLMVYCLHVAIFTNNCAGGQIFDKAYMKVFQTPAWGGVWIFFILSGYLAGKGFFDGRYVLEKKSIFLYYKKKFIKVLVPTFAFILLCCVLVYPEFVKDNPEFLFRLFTFSYNGRPGADGISAAWYVFTLVPLYLLTPLFCFIVLKAEKKRLVCALISALIIVGFLYRFFAVKCGFDWFNMVYTPFFANIDLFFSGICISYLAKSLSDKRIHGVLFKDFSLFLLFVFILLNSVVFFMKFYIYAIVFPTIYLLLVGGCLLVFSDEKWRTCDSPLEKALSIFSSISFEFYLFHSLILHTFSTAFNENNIVVLHFKLLFTGFILTFIFAQGFHKIFASQVSRVDVKCDRSEG